MKFSNVAKGTRAVKLIEFRFANAPAAQPGQATPGESACFKLGVRVLTGTETAEVYEKAASDAAAKGVKEWKEEHPLCRLYLMAHTLAIGCVEMDEATGAVVVPHVPCFDGALEILSSQDIGTDNIVFLYEEWVKWQDACSLRIQKLTDEQIIATVIADMDRKEGDPGPLAGLGHATLVSCTRFMANLSFSLLTDRLRTGSPSGTAIPETSSSQPQSEPTAGPPAMPPARAMTEEP